MNTAAAFANPLCRKDAGPYGNLDFVNEGCGPVCVAVWKDGADNGGATYQGVTKDSIAVVVLVPNDQQLAGARPGQSPVDHATGGKGTVTNAFKDTFAAFEHQAHQTYGRKINLVFVTSSGDDEAAQRADAVAVKAMKPFAVIDGTYTSQPVFGTDLAAAKIPVFANTTSLEATLKQAPYRWAQTDVNAGAMNAAEFMGKQLAGKKAEYAGDEALHSQTRKFGVVYADPVTDTDLFNKTAAKYGVKFAPGASISYPATDDPFGNPTVAQEQAPVAIAKFKSAGVTTILLLTDSAMTGGLLKQATANDYHPEWIIGAFQYNDIGFFARQYDQDQWSHAFGISNLPPGIKQDVAATANPALDAVRVVLGQGPGYVERPAREPHRQVHRAASRTQVPSSRRRPSSRVSSPRRPTEAPRRTTRTPFGRDSAAPTDSPTTSTSPATRTSPRPGGIPTPRDRRSPTWVCRAGRAPSTTSTTRSVTTPATGPRNR